MNLNFDPDLPDTEDHAPIKFSVCTKTVDVKLGQALMNLLLEPGDLEGTDDTKFDLWMHTLVAHACNDYNRM